MECEGSGTIDGRAWQMARATGNSPSQPRARRMGYMGVCSHLDVAALYARKMPTIEPSAATSTAWWMRRISARLTSMCSPSRSLATACGWTTAMLGRFTPAPAARPFERSSRTCLSGPG